MQSLSQVHTATARFTERKTIPLLTAPLLASGTLTYVAPAYMRKTTLTPVPEDFVLDHGQITLSTGGQTHVLSLSADPRIGGLVEGVLATLAGDLPTLEQYYTVKLSGTAAQWQLTLQPRDAGLRQFVSWIIIQGAQDRVTAIDSADAQGGHAEMGVAETVTHGP